MFRSAGRWDLNRRNHGSRGLINDPGYIPAANLKLLWLVGLFDFIGGGGSFFSTLIRTIIAEAVPSDALLVFGFVP